MKSSLSARTEQWLRAGWRFLPVMIVLLIWQLTVDLDLVDRAFLPPVNTVAAALWDMTRNGELAFNLAISVYRAFAGLAIGSFGLGGMVHEPDCRAKVGESLERQQAVD